MAGVPLFRIRHSNSGWTGISGAFDGNPSGGKAGNGAAKTIASGPAHGSKQNITKTIFLSKFFLK